MDQQLMDRIEEAAWLPAGDPVRQETEALMAKAEPWAARAWEARLAEAETLQSDLREVPIPPGLIEKLSAIPDQPVRQPGRQGRPRRRWMLAAAALVAVCLASAWGLGLFGVAPDPEMLRIADLAVANHVHDQHVVVETDDPETLRKALADSGKLPFEAEMPEMEKGYVLLGGRSCALGKSPVVFSRWKGPRHNCSMFQFDPRDFTLASASAAELRAQGYKVKIWVSSPTVGFVKVNDK